MCLNIDRYIHKYISEIQQIFAFKIVNINFFKIIHVFFFSITFLLRENTKSFQNKYSSVAVSLKLVYFLFLKVGTQHPNPASERNCFEWHYIWCQSHMLVLRIQHPRQFLPLTNIYIFRAKNKNTWNNSKHKCFLHDIPFWNANYFYQLFIFFWEWMYTKYSKNVFV